MHNSDANTTQSSSPTRGRSSKRHLDMKKSATFEFGVLSEYKSSIPTQTLKAITVERLISYTQTLTDHIYQSDPLKIKEFLLEFLQTDLAHIRPKLQERLSLLKYLSESLKYKQFTEIESEILKEWRKNVLLISLNTIWLAKMGSAQFESAQQFFDEYHKYIELVANLTHFYFAEAFVLLKIKQVDHFQHLQQETAHRIINSLNEWEQLYHDRLLPLLKAQSHASVSFNFDISKLRVDPRYVDIHNEAVQLPKTISSIKSFASEYTIICKIQRLKEFRQTFLKEIEESRIYLAKIHQYNEYRALEKDDIIDLIIYCIIKGQIEDLAVRLVALAGLLGPHSQLLSRKGVDSFRADLLSAVTFLSESEEPPPKELKQKELRKEPQQQVVSRQLKQSGH